MKPDNLDAVIEQITYIRGRLEGLASTTRHGMSADLREDIRAIAELLKEVVEMVR